MAKIEIIPSKSNEYCVKGDLVFNTINKAALQILKFPSSGDKVTLDLQLVGKIDSAGLALLIEWKKLARSAQTQLHFKHIPSQLTILAKLCDIPESDLFTS